MIDIKTNYIADNLKHFRKIMGLNKEQLANILGTTGMQIGYLERNMTPSPSYILIEAITDYFGVDLKSFVRVDLRDISLDEMRLQRGIRVIPALSQAEMRTSLAVYDDLVNMLRDKGFFQISQRQIR